MCHDFVILDSQCLMQCLHPLTVKKLLYHEIVCMCAVLTLQIALLHLVCQQKFFVGKLTKITTNKQEKLKKKLSNQGTKMQKEKRSNK